MINLDVGKSHHEIQTWIIMINEEIELSVMGTKGYDLIQR